MPQDAVLIPAQPVGLLQPHSLATLSCAQQYVSFEVPQPHSLATLVRRDPLVSAQARQAEKAADRVPLLQCLTACCSCAALSSWHWATARQARKLWARRWFTKWAAAARTRRCLAASCSAAASQPWKAAASLAFIRCCRCGAACQRWLTSTFAAGAALIVCELLP